MGAAAMLGRWHRVGGRVTHGFGRGKGLGFPTANLTDMDVLLPGSGVYATIVRRGLEQWRGVTNIGHNPTFGPAGLSVETFLLDTDINLYDADIALDFVDRLRDEITFASGEELSRQIDADVRHARTILANPPQLW